MNDPQGHPSGIVELSDDDMMDLSAGSGWGCFIGTIGISIAICSPNGTLCGSCQMGTRGCC